VTLFLQLFALGAACYVAVFAREQLRRRHRRLMRRREWRALDQAPPQRGRSTAPPQTA